MKTNIFIFKNKPLLLIAMVCIVASITFSCKTDELVTAAPVIEFIRITDPLKSDSLVTKAAPGAMIVIQGKNFDKLKSVTFNGYPAGVNPAYCTSTNIIVRIPKLAPVKALSGNPNMLEQVIVETENGVAIHNFKLLAKAPFLSVKGFEYVILDPVTGNPTPVKVGQTVTVNGGNFLDIDSIVFETFPNLNAVDPMERTAGGNFHVQNWTVSSDTAQIVFQVPQGAQYDGNLWVYCAAGKVGGGFFRVAPPSIETVSPTTLIPGDKLDIYGKYLYNIDTVFIYNQGNTESYKITSNNFTVNSDANLLTVKLPNVNFKSSMLVSLKNTKGYEVNFLESGTLNKALINLKNGMYCDFEPILNLGLGKFYPINIWGDAQGKLYDKSGTDKRSTVNQETDIQPPTNINGNVCAIVRGYPYLGPYYFGNIILQDDRIQACPNISLPNSTKLANLAIEFNFYMSAGNDPAWPVPIADGKVYVGYNFKSSTGFSEVRTPFVPRRPLNIKADEDFYLLPKWVRPQTGKWYSVRIPVLKNDKNSFLADKDLGYFKLNSNYVSFNYGNMIDLYGEVQIYIDDVHFVLIK